MKTQFGMQQPLFYLIQKEVKKLQKKKSEYQKSAEYLPNSCKIPINEYLKPFISLQLVNLHDYVVSASNALPIAEKVKKKSSKKAETLVAGKDALLLKVRDSESSLKKHKSADRRKSKKLSQINIHTSAPSSICLENSDFSKNEEFLELQENYSELQNKYNSLNTELLEERNKQQEASANVQKLAQVVKLMKLKYDSLKDQKSSPSQSPSTLPASRSSFISSLLIFYFPLSLFSLSLFPLFLTFLSFSLSHFPLFLFPLFLSFPLSLSSLSHFPCFRTFPLSLFLSPSLSLFSCCELTSFHFPHLFRLVFPLFPS